MTPHRYIEGDTCGLPDISGFTAPKINAIFMVRICDLNMEGI
jgi:hypothetical protein